MRRIVPHFLIGRHVAGWVLPLLAVLLYAPTAAHGSCGDHVRIRGTSALAAKAGEPMPLPQTPDASKLPSKPCSGFLCANVPHSQPLPTPPPPSERGEQLADIISILYLNAPLPQLDSDNSAGQLAIHRPSAVFHPPRLTER